MLITDKQLLKIIPNSNNISIARKYCKNGYVKKITIKNNNGRYIIDGKVDNGSYENECWAVVDTDNQIIAYHCDCFWCNQNSACGHVGAMLFKVQELSPDEYPFEYINEFETERISFLERIAEIRKQQELQRINSELSVTKNIINTFKNTKKIEFDTLHQLKNDIEVQIITGYDLYILKFKVGNKRKYAIKNIGNFLDAIYNKELVYYGKQLEFIHNENAFSEDALKIIELMKGCYHLDEHHYANKNELGITYENIDLIYQTLTSLTNSNQHLKLNEIKKQLTLEIEPIDDYYSIKLEEIDGFFGVRDIYLVDDNQIDVIKLDEEGKVMQFLLPLARKEELLLAKEDILDFKKYIFDDLKDYFVIKGTKLPGEVVSDEQLTLYGDIDDNDLIKIYLKSKQQDQEIYSFDHQNKKTSVNFDLIEDYLQKMAAAIIGRYACFELEAEKTYQFLNEGLPFLSKYCEVLVSDALQKIGRKSQFSITVGVKIENDLLSIDVDSIDIPKEELAGLLKSYHRKKKFHRLKNGKLLYLQSDELEELDQFLTVNNLDLKTMKDGHLDTELYRVFNVENQLENSEHLMVERSEKFKSIIDNFSDTKNQNYPLSKHYENILRDYQKFGYQWLQQISAYGLGGILADDMGLGKTLQIITLLDENRANDKTSLVICPSSLMLNWQSEINKFSNHLTCKCIHGNLNARKQALKAFNDVDVLITTYDYLRRDHELYQDHYFEYIILDEAQYIKNPKTKNASAVKSLKAKHRLALTGTPIENSLAELWSIFDFLMPSYLYNYHYFQKNYESLIVKEHDENKQLELKKMISPFILRRNKKDVLSELPEKIEKTILLEFSEEEKKLYLANLMQVSKELQDQLNNDDVDRIAILAMLTRLRQLCCEPRLIYDNVHSISSKLVGCMDLIRNFLGNNQKVLLFSSFTSMLDLISEELEKEGISYYKLTGSTPKEKRHQLVEQFQHDDTTVFLISLKAGGTGLNLTAAQAVIHYDPWWNMSAQNQATDRAYRIGQKNVVNVYKLVMKDSVEEKILKLQEEKKNLADTFVENNQGAITTMTSEEIMNLFSL